MKRKIKSLNRLRGANWLRFVRKRAAPVPFKTSIAQTPGSAPSDTDLSAAGTSQMGSNARESSEERDALKLPRFVDLMGIY
jgi:hypothetical protein